MDKLLLPLLSDHFHIQIKTYKYVIILLLLGILREHIII